MCSSGSVIRSAAAAASPAMMRICAVWLCCLSCSLLSDFLLLEALTQRLMTRERNRQTAPPAASCPASGSIFMQYLTIK